MVCAAQAVTKTLVSPTLTLTAPPASWAMEPVENVSPRPGTVTECFCCMIFLSDGAYLRIRTGRPATRVWFRPGASEGKQRRHKGRARVLGFRNPLQSAR